MPAELPILPLRNTVGLPFVVMPLTVGIKRSVRLVEDALAKDRLIGLAASRDAGVEEPGPSFSVTRPPRTGPARLAAVRTAPKMPCILPRFAGRKASAMMVKERGIGAAAPRPCRAVAAE